MEGIHVLLCYACEDEKIMKELAIHLGVLKHQNILHVWHNGKITAGTERAREIDIHFSTAQIIVLLISQHFMNSDYCYCYEMEKAVERHDQGKTRVIPVILRPVYYQKAPFAKLSVLPANGKPIISWANKDEAIFNVAEGIRIAAEDL